MKLVVGSGPAGVAAALALLDRGEQVTMIDFGRTIEPEAAALAAPIAGRPYEAWPAEARERLARIEGPTIGGFPMKTNFGSDFGWRPAPEFMPMRVKHADLLVSFARGGLSNLWGSNVFTFGAEDVHGWPFGLDALTPGYRAVLKHVPLSAGRGDDLEAELPLHTDALQPRLLSEQAQAVLASLTRHRDALHADGVTFGPSRLGIRTAAESGQPGCERCGLCLHGCPLDLIYCSSHTLATLAKHPDFRYEGGLYASTFREDEHGVTIEARRTGDRSVVRFEGTRAFLGCGCYSTARLVLESLGRFDLELAMLESQYFLIPMLSWRDYPRVTSERLQTLSQLALRLRDANVSPRDVELLLYTYSPIYRTVVAASPARFVPGAQRLLLGRLMALQGYLHSDVSPRLALTLRRGGDGASVLDVEGRPSAEAKATVGRVLARVRAMGPALQASPIPFMTKIAPPGKSFHGGGTFPMEREPGALASDPLGRPMGLKRVHVVDASVFPTIPATNLTLTVMANAWRIAHEAAGLDAGRATTEGVGA